MNRPRCPLAALLLAALLLPALHPVQAADSGDAASGVKASDAKASDPQAIAIAERVMAALGGRQAWDQTHFLHFTFAGRRTHDWDKLTGRHRLEGTTREGQHYVVLQNVVTREGGEAFLDGQKLSGDAAKEYLDNAYGAWINDTYWLLMPYKLLDPGVILTYDRAEEANGTTYDVLRLRFEHVGLTPGDTYWAYINRETGLMDRWAYFLESYEAGTPPTEWEWTGWSRYGHILLAPNRLNPASGRDLPLSDIAVSDSVPDSVFTTP